MYHVVAIQSFVCNTTINFKKAVVVTDSRELIWRWRIRRRDNRLCQVESHSSPELSLLLLLHRLHHCRHQPAINQSINQNIYAKVFTMSLVSSKIWSEIQAESRPKYKTWCLLQIGKKSETDRKWINNFIAPQVAYLIVCRGACKRCVSSQVQSTVILLTLYKTTSNWYCTVKSIT